MRILILGATGLLGATLVPLLIRNGHDIVRHGNHTECDISCDLTNTEAAHSLFDKVNPDIIINLVALTNVDLCEKEIHQAYLLNVKTVENVVSGILKKHQNTFLIHISTDQVYDSKELSCENEIKLTNTYALTKYASELAAKFIPSTILRTNFFGQSLLVGRESFSDWILNSLRNNNSITVFNDIVINPLSMKSLSEIIESVIKNRIEGVFNIGSHGAMSKADIAFEIAQLYNVPTQNMKRGLSTDIDLLAYRPKNMSMNCTKFEETYNYKLPTLLDEINSIKEKLNVKA